jgi:hypothetical protein
MEEVKEDNVLGLYTVQYDQTFIDHLTKMLSISIPEKYIRFLLQDKNMSYFFTAFTDPKADLDNNYLFLRTVGHVSYEKILVWYLSRKVPGIFTKNGQKIATILKSQIASSKKLGFFMQRYHPQLWDYISMPLTDHNNLVLSPSLTEIERQEIIDDRHVIFQSIFESVFGAIELLLDQKEIGMGNIILTEWFGKIFDDYIPIDFNVNPIHHKHPKTKLNDILVRYNIAPSSAGKFEYSTTADPSSTEKSKRFITEIRQVNNAVPISTIMGYGKSRDNKVSEKYAALECLKYIKANGLPVYNSVTRKITNVHVNVLDTDPLDPYDD